MISPAHLRARREALGITRETVAAFSPSGTNGSAIRNLERPRVGRWHQWHIDALDKIDAWFDSSAEHVEQWIRTTALKSNIDGVAVLWTYSQESFDRCPVNQLCLGHADLYNVCKINVRADIVANGYPVIDAEFISDAFDQFRERISSDSHHPELMAKWWRHFTATYKGMA